MAEPSLILLVVALPAAFAAIWLLVTTILGAWSGWFRLQHRYAADLLQADGSLPTATIRPTTAWVGAVRFNNVLRISVRPEGLGFSVLRLLGPFQTPLLIPWSAVHARAGEPMVFLGPTVRLEFGSPPLGELLIAESDWRRLVAARPALASLVGDR